MKINFSKKLLKYINGTIISPSFVPSLPDCFVIFRLNLNKILLLLLLARKSIIFPKPLKAGSSLYYYHKLHDVFEYISLYSIKL